MKLTNKINADVVKQFCPSCDEVTDVARLIDKTGNYVAWCPCGAMFDKQVIILKY